jgi:hypothetical protein
MAASTAILPTSVAPLLFFAAKKAVYLVTSMAPGDSRVARKV